MVIMTPEEKAIDLIEKFTHGGLVNWNAAKKDAMVCVEEIIAERKRAVQIAYEFFKKHAEAGKSKRNAKNELAFVEEDIADVSRLIGNAISGNNALSSEDYLQQVKSHLEKQ